jgi:hypothetical protein
MLTLVLKQVVKGELLAWPATDCSKAESLPMIWEAACRKQS